MAGVGPSTGQPIVRTIGIGSAFTPAGVRTIVRQEDTMTYGTRTDHYPATSKLLHWLVAACVLTTAPVAIAMVRVGKGPTQDTLYAFHKSLGVLILVLMILRLINRLVVGAPIPDPQIEPWQKAVSATVHTTLYVLLLAMPVVGYIANSAYGATTPFFGLFELPMIVDKNEALATQLFALHRWVGFLVILLVVVHISAALYHHFVRGDQVLRRMLPRALTGSDAVTSPAVRSGQAGSISPRSR
jgi:cytochrome b561